MKRSFKLAASGLLAYFLALLVLFPAAQAWQLAKPYLPAGLPLQPHALQGTLWKGSAETLSWHDTPLGRLHWHLSPWTLLLGKAGLSLQLQDDDKHLDSRLQVARDGSLNITQLDMRLPAGELARFNPGLPIAADGLLLLHLDGAVMAPGTAPELRGNAVWQEAVLVIGEVLQLGDLHLALQPGENGGTQATIRDSGGPLEISGSIQLEAGMRYQFEARVKARPEADPGLHNSLGLLGKADGRGYRTLRYRGHLR